MTTNHDWHPLCDYDDPMRVDPFGDPGPGCFMIIILMAVMCGVLFSVWKS